MTLGVCFFLARIQSNGGFSERGNEHSGCAIGAELSLVERLSACDEGVPAMEILSQYERQLSTALRRPAREITT